MIIYVIHEKFKIEYQNLFSKMHFDQNILILLYFQRTCRHTQTVLFPNRNRILTKPYRTRNELFRTCTVLDHTRPY